MEEMVAIGQGVFALINQLKTLPSTVAQIVEAIGATPTADILAVRESPFLVHTFLVTAARDGGLEPEIAIAVTSPPPVGKQQEGFRDWRERMLYFAREIKKRTGVNFPDNWNASSAFYLIDRLLTKEQLTDLSIGPYARKDKGATNFFEILQSKAAPSYKKPGHEFYEWAMTAVPRQRNDERNVDTEEIATSVADSKEIDIFNLEAGGDDNHQEVEAVGKQATTISSAPTAAPLTETKKSTTAARTKGDGKTAKKTSSKKKSAGATASGK